MIKKKKEQYKNKISQRKFTITISIVFLILWILLLFVFIFTHLPPLYIIVAIVNILFNLSCTIVNIIEFTREKNKYRELCLLEEEQTKLCPYFIDSEGNFYQEGY